MIVTISGTAGSGKSTVAKMISKKLKLKRYYMGGMRREMAREQGMTLREFNALGEKEFSTDKVVDNFQTKLGKTKDNILVEGRTSYHLIPQSIKIFLTVDKKVGAQRIFKDLKKNKASRNEAEDDKMKTVKDIVKLEEERFKSDTKRYRKYYGIDVYDQKNYDLVIDTTNIRPEAVAKQIVDFCKARKGRAKNGRK